MADFSTLIIIITPGSETHYIRQMCTCVTPKFLNEWNTDFNLFVTLKKINIIFKNIGQNIIFSLNLILYNNFQNGM